MTWFALLFLDYLSCALLALSAAFRGGRHGLPFTGTVILGMACALSSPLTRALMILISGQAALTRLEVIDERGYVAASLIGACAGRLLQGRAPEEGPLFPMLDGASLALATALGAYVALELGPTGAVWAVIIGCVAGTAGGVLRDVCLTERPALLEADFYGSAVVVGAMAVTGLHVLHADCWAQLAAGFVCIFSLRLLGSRRMKRLGVFSEF